MAYTLQTTSDPMEVVSDLESIIGSTVNTQRGQALPSSRLQAWAGTAALVALGVVLIVAPSSKSNFRGTSTSGIVGLSSQNKTEGANWDQILLEEAHEIDATWHKLKADQAEFKKTGGWEKAHQISKDHDRLKIEEAGFDMAEVMSKQQSSHPHGATSSLRAAALSPSTAHASTTSQEPSSVSVHSQAPTGLPVKEHVESGPTITATDPMASQSTESVSTTLALKQAQSTINFSVVRKQNMSQSMSQKSASSSLAPHMTTSIHIMKQTSEPPVPPSTTLVSRSSNSESQNLSALAEEFLAEAQKYGSNSSDMKSMVSIAQMLKKTDETTLANPVESPLAPKEALHDGNKCPEDEEEYPKTGGTCFKKCSDLTGGAYPIRSTAFSCCKSEPCGIGNSKIHLNFCGGFDVAGNAEGNGCPSSEGACLKDEELLGGICYKKCSSFEGGDVYYHRVAPNICCRTKGIRCMLPSYFKFSSKFANGGGAGDGNSATPAIPHAPIQTLTEVAA